MSQNRTTEPVQPGKRLACERCRAQKLKCIRTDNSSHICQRCTTAKTVCSFGVPRPSGRPPLASNSASSLESCSGRKKNRAWQHEPHCGHHEERTLRLPHLAPATSYGQPNIGLVSQNPQLGNNPQGYLETNLPPASQPVSAHADSHIEPEALLNGIREQDFMDFDRNDGERSWSTPTGFSEITADGEGSDIFDHADNAHLQQRQPSRHIDVSITSPSLFDFADFPIVSQSPGERQRAGLEQSEGYRPTNPFDMEDVTPSTSTSSSAQLSRQGSVRSNTLRVQIMQQISRLGVALDEIFPANHEQDEEGIADNNPLEGFPAVFAGKVLQASQMFLKVLRSFAVSDPSRPFTPVASDSIHNGTALEALKSNPLFSLDFRGQQPWDFLSRNSRSSVPASAPSVKEKITTIPVNKPTALQLLACYIRFVQLHSILYDEILRHVKTMDCNTHARLSKRTMRGSLSESDTWPYDNANPFASDQQIPAIFPDLELGGFSLSEFGNFQMVLVLQVCTHLLSEVEVALGLSEGCRVSRRSMTEGSGILGASVTAQFIEMSMSDFGTGNRVANGSGKDDYISHVRDVLVKLQAALGSKKP